MLEITYMIYLVEEAQEDSYGKFRGKKFPLSFAVSIRSPVFAMKPEHALVFLDSKSYE